MDRQARPSLACRRSVEPEVSASPASHSAAWQAQAVSVHVPLAVPQLAPVPWSLDRRHLPPAANFKLTFELEPLAQAARLRLGPCPAGVGSTT